MKMRSMIYKLEVAKLECFSVVGMGFAVHKREYS
jgi:hypothetical protein